MISEQQYNHFFRLAECNALYLHEDRDASAALIERLRQGELQGILVHDVYPQKMLPTIVQQLQLHSPAFLKTGFPDAFNGWFYGQNLNLYGPDLDDYFLQAEQFELDTEALLPGQWNPAVRIASILTQLDGKRPFVAPTNPHTGQRYMFTTFREHAPGGYIPAHCDNEFMLRPSYRQLRAMCDPHIISFVVAFNDVDSGGTTQIYNLTQQPVAQALMSDDQHAVKPALDNLDSVQFRIPAGSMLLFDSGRYLHRLEPVGGTCSRWTACSFMALSSDHRAMYVWG